MHRRFLLVAGCLMIAGCGAGQRTPNPFESGPGGADQIQVRVENLNFNDATLHALTEGARIRMGRVSGKSNGTFRVDWPFVRDLRVEISLLASDTYTTPRLTVSPGESIRLMIQTPLNRSFLIR